MPTRYEFAPIVEASEVAALQGVVACDVRWYLDGRSGRDAYDAGHLPGAVFIDLDEHLTSIPGPTVGRHPLPTPEAFARSMGDLGIGPDDPVVAYDDAGGMAAGRLVWMLRVLGRPAALLDGGVGAWDGPLETSPTVRSPVVMPVEPWPVGAVATIDEVAAVAASGVAEGTPSAEKISSDGAPAHPRSDSGKPVAHRALVCVGGQLGSGGGSVEGNRNGPDDAGQRKLLTPMPIMLRW